MDNLHRDTAPSWCRRGILETRRLENGLATGRSSWPSDIAETSARVQPKEVASSRHHSLVLDGPQGHTRSRAQRTTVDPTSVPVPTPILTPFRPCWPRLRRGRYSFWNE